jgi:hypothetical protein
MAPVVTDIVAKRFWASEGATLIQTINTITRVLIDLDVAICPMEPTACWGGGAYSSQSDQCSLSTRRVTGVLGAGSQAPEIHLKRELLIHSA